jgi:hypothetical protein
LNTEELLQKIRDENLGVYGSSASRLQEDVSNEAEIAHDYQGRLVYELLQNADDAMAGADSADDQIIIKVTDDELWVGNSGRPLSEADVRGLCGIGASSKRSTGEKRRASIGHKGMGFKSVLEFTDTPEVYSLTHSMVMDAARAASPIRDLFRKLQRELPEQFPVMRLPWPVESLPDYWHDVQGNRIQTLFRFPFGTKVDSKKRGILIQALLDLPVTTVLFLKHLEKVEIEIATSDVQERHSWELQRDHWVAGGWTPSDGLHASGLYRVWISTGGGDTWSFLLCHNEDIPIGVHREGLNDHFWAGVDLTEISIAVLELGEETDTLPTHWRHFHLFLPTCEPCPYGFLVNGAFTTDISRQEIRVTKSKEDYNSHLLRSVAKTFAEEMLPRICDEHGPERLLGMLDRTTSSAPSELTAATVLHGALCRELADKPFTPAEDGNLVALSEMLVPLVIDCETAGQEFRQLLPVALETGGRKLPAPVFCRASAAKVAVDLGAKELCPQAMVELMGRCDPTRSRLQKHATLSVKVDPVLDVMVKYWQHLDSDSRQELQEAAKHHPVFPVRATPEGVVHRESVAGSNCFYPQQSLTATDLPLRGLRFMLQDVCWGGLSKLERGEVLRDFLTAWQALFDVKDFKFPDVMRASVLPCLELNPSEEVRTKLEELKNLDALSAICQLAGSTTKPESPLRYERLRSTRALFNLCRLPVPCQIGRGEVQWIPAYRVYFGADWGDEHAIDSVLNELSPTDAELLAVPILAPPSLFEGALERYKSLAPELDQEVNDSEEVNLDVDDDAAIETEAMERWRSFFLWLGVNKVLRPVHFHDAEDAATGWLKTKNLAKPQGWVFKSLGGSWTRYEAYLRDQLAKRTDTDGVVYYYYELHDLEYLTPLLQATEADADGHIAAKLFAHLAMHWPSLMLFRRVQLAFVGEGKYPGNRSTPPRAMESELKEVGSNFWLHRLRTRSFCPTSHGPRTPAQTWLLTSEILRRFERRGSTASRLLPILEDVVDVRAGASFSREMGIRDAISPSTFTLEDARVLCAQMQKLYREEAENGLLGETVLSQSIRPAYRNLFELLAGSRRVDDTPPLGDVPLLEHDGNGVFRFTPAGDVHYTDRNGIREVYSISQPVWTFVLEAHPAARRLLPELFGTKLLEDSLEWSPDPGECALDSEGLRTFRQELEELCCVLLARLRVERNDDVRVQRDATLLRRFIAAAEPVQDLELSCRFQGEAVQLERSRPAYVQDDGDRLQAFVVWDDGAWPPSPGAAEGLALALGDLLQVSYLESFLSLILAPPERRLHVLKLAGAVGFLEDSTQRIRGLETADARQDPSDLGATGSMTVKTTPDVNGSDEEASPPWQRPELGSEPPSIPLVSLDELNVRGTPVKILGTRSFSEQGVPTGVSGGSSGRHENGRPGRYGGQTDLTELDQIGMQVTMAYECERLAKAGYEYAGVFGVEQANGHQPLVFDVSTVEAIDAALAGCPPFKLAMRYLRSLGVSDMYPGFDVLTLDPATPGTPDRLIELKSSGVSARVQGMTWNEWKTAANSKLREMFYLYLVGNLRADMPHAKPFIRTIRDPISNLSTKQVTTWAARQMVQLRTAEFVVADHLDLQ